MAIAAILFYSRLKLKILLRSPLPYVMDCTRWLRSPCSTFHFKCCLELEVIIFAFNYSRLKLKIRLCCSYLMY